MPSTALYKSVVPCTWPVTAKDGNYKHQYFPADCELTVPKGEIVGPSFVPVDNQAQKDREDQVINPDKHHKGDKFRLAILAELLVKENGLRDTKGLDDKGKVITTRFAKTEAMSLILGVDDSKIEAATDPVATAKAAIMEGLDAKGMRALLKKHDVKFFQGLKESQLAEVIYKEGLHTEI